MEFLQQHRAYHLSRLDDGELETANSNNSWSTEQSTWNPTTVFVPQTLSDRRG